jgi:hypothetical protein
MEAVFGRVFCTDYNANVAAFGGIDGGGDSFCF